MYQPLDLVVFSHLRWNFVWQRPQHLLTRLAAKRRILFIEEPAPAEAHEPRWEKQIAAPNITVCRLRSPEPSFGFADKQLDLLQPQLANLLREEGIRECSAWFYTPLALPLLDSVPHRAIVYDCMDELSAFHGAPAAMLQREAELLQKADIVFTGGPSLYRAKKDRHPNVHCFPSSVDLGHFRQACAGIAEAPEQASLPHPRLGFFGVIDERFDVALLDAIAQARPSWQFVMVGPVVKINPAALPRHANIHYYGQRSYKELPAFLAGWDVCLLPFARNEATRYISPTKTLEYMAAERPIVSTPITDVAEPYSAMVYLGDNAETFLKGCEQALAESSSEQESRRERMRAVLARTSWEATAEAMSLLLDQASAERAARPAVTALPQGMPPVVVIGAGPTGLSAAYHLGAEALLLERNQRVGGWCRSIFRDGFTFDFAGHIMFSKDPYVHQMYEMLLGDSVHWQDREAWIYSKDVYTRYPFQGSLYGLPPQVIKECIVGAIEARFGNVKPAPPAMNGKADCAAKPHTNGQHHGNGRVHGKPESLNDCCGDGILESTARLGAAVSSNGHAQAAPAAPPGNFEEFIYKVWGAGIARHFAIPYNRKLWAVPLTEMETSWLGGRVPLPDLEEMIEGALSPTPKPMGPNARFGYPLRGGFQALMDGFLPRLKGPVWLNTSVAGISPSRHMLTLCNGKEIPYEQLISTMPLPVLIRQMGAEAPAEVQQAAARLRSISVRCVHLGIGRENLTDKHWIYYPEDTVFHRIFVQGNASPYCNPPGGFGLTCEITYHAQYKPLPCDGEELIQRCISDCQRVGFFKPADPVWTACQVDLPHAYVVYDHERSRNVALIRAWLEEQDILLAGRYSEWEYYNSDHAFLAGKKVAELAQQRLGQTAAVPG